MSEQTGTEEEGTSPPRKKRRWRWLAYIAAVPAVFVLLAGVLVLVVPGQTIPMPDFLAQRVEAELARGLGQGSLRVDRAEMTFDRRGGAVVVLRDLALRDAGGARLGQVTEIQAAFPAGVLLGRAAAPDRLSLSGAQITLRRSSSGEFSLTFGGGETTRAGSVAELLDQLDTAFSQTPLSGIEEIAADDVTIILEDARTGRVWQATSSRAVLKNEPERIELTVFSEVFNGTETLATLESRFEKTKGQDDAELAVSLTGAAAEDIAQQSPALSYLAVLDAPVSGSIHVDFRDAALSRLDASLEIAAGFLAPVGAAAPIPFDQGSASLSYDATRQRIDFEEVAFRSQALSVAASGHAYLAEFSGGWPGALIAQLDVSEMRAAAMGIFDEAVSLDGGYADLRVRLDPFAVDVGQAIVREGDSTIRARVSVAADPTGWRVATDISADKLTPAKVLAFWPMVAADGVRRWISENLRSGTLTDITAAVRTAPSEAPRVGLTFAFEDATVRHMPDMPPITEGRGSAALTEDAFSLRLASGIVTPDDGGALDISGSSIRIGGFGKPVQDVDIDLDASGALKSVLTLLDSRPFRLLERTDLTADIATATAKVDARIAFPLLKELPAERVDYTVAGTLSDVASTALVPGRALEADRLAIGVTPGRVDIEGPVRVDGLPIDVVVTQRFGKGVEAMPEISGTVELSQRFLETFGIGLPEGTVSGQSAATLDLVLAPEEPPAFSLSSDLGGLALSIPTLSWEKAAGTLGALEIEGTLGEQPTIDRIALESLGLSVEGTITLSEGGRLETAEFDRVASGQWLDAAVRLESRGQNVAPRVRILGGRVDLQARPARPSAGEGPPVPLDVALDRLRITETITVTDLRADVLSDRGFSGSFRGRVNGGTPVRGELAPQRGRTAIRIQGDDAGGVLRDARIFESLRDGTFELILAPRAEGRGFDGRLQIKNTRLGDQPALVGLLDAVSVVGLLDEARGPGILFDTVDAQFRLLPDRLILDKASGVGASLGLSIDGVYALQTKQIDFQGVLSPIYLLNSVGQVFTRSGEGLFGFTFRLTGNADAPRVSVNPLSILTPGMFREIFRRPPPNAPSQ